jgi:ABC-2 type transport system permease protein
MLKDLLLFDWLFFSKKKALYASLTLFLGLGIMVAVFANFPWIGTNKNSPFVLTYLLGLFSLTGIFVIAILAAQSLFREKEYHFDLILYATPLNKRHYLTSRLTTIFQICFLHFLLFAGGMILGHQFLRKATHIYGNFNLWYYLQPFLVIVIPNILFCLAVIGCLGAVTKNKMMIYVAGLFLYFLYWGIAIFTNSPLVAGNQPVSAEAMSLSAKLDPFGISAFLEQTRYWSAQNRNSQVLSLEGNFLINRIIYLFVSFGLIVFTYRKLQFTLHSKKQKNTQNIQEIAKPFLVYQPIQTNIFSTKYVLQSIWSIVRIDFSGILRSIPFMLFVLGWLIFVSIEIFSDINGSSRMPERFATTHLLVNQILDAFPDVAIILLLFYGSEIFWKSKAFHFQDIETSTPVSKFSITIAKWAVLVLIGFVLIACNILLCLFFQVVFEHFIFNWSLYFSLFYVLGLPLALSSAIIILFQKMLQKKYLALVTSSFILTIMNTSVGKWIGIKHPLLRFTKSLQGMYSDMTGFGAYLDAFHFKVLFGISVIISLCFVWYLFFPLQSLKKQKISYLTLFASTLSAIIIGFFIIKETHIQTTQEINDWKQAYELQYKPYNQMLLPTITDVKTHIDLFPDQNRYQVSGTYMLVNKHNTPLKEVLIYLDKSIQWKSISVEKAKRTKKDDMFGHELYTLLHPLVPNDSLKVYFTFEYSWSAFTGHTSFNSILENGSFMRISNYFPRFGYQSENEITDLQERKYRKLPPSTPLMTIKNQYPTPFNYEFINLETTISTSKDQTAIGVGEFVDSWQKNNRNYFKYKTTSPIPFRFAVASAQYQTKKIMHQGIVVEAFYHPSHHQNIDYLLKTATQTLDYCEANFGKYPFKSLRFVEISSFVKGFAGTAYPNSFFIPENFGFQSKIENNAHKDIINELVSHELSHTWWGNSQISPPYQEGSKILTETLAMYTELMLYKQTYGEESLTDRVQIHKDIYLGDRGIEGDEPLYTSHPNKPFLCYDKGMVVMYQLYKLIGEKNMNTAFKKLLEKYAYPHQPPTSLNLVEELKTVSDTAIHVKIDELFKTITTYNLSVQSASVMPKGNDYLLSFKIEAKKYLENIDGSRKNMAFHEPVEIQIEFQDGTNEHFILKPQQFKSNITLKKKPKHLILDPKLRFIDISEENNEKSLY